jgi:hypothetical protein
MKLLLMTAVAAMALGAVSASSASATIVSAKYSSQSFKLTSPGITIKKNGSSAKACTMAPVTVETEGDGFIGTNEFFFGLKFTCSGSWPLVMNFNGRAKYDTVTGRYWLQVADLDNQTQESPWGFYYQETNDTDQWTWVNGSGSTPSTITLNERWVGLTATGSEKITITGTLTAKTSSGGLITLSH